MTRSTSHIIAAIAAIACCNIAFGLAAQLLPLLMEGQGFSARFMGISAAMWPLGVFSAGWFLPRVIKHYGGRNVALLAIVSLALCLALFPITSPATTWFALRFVFGIAIASLFTVSEAWILAEAGDGRRAQVIGIYMTVLTTSFGVGPLLLPFTGTASYAPWLIGIAGLLIGLVVIGSANIPNAKSDAAHSRLSDVLAKLPLVFFCIVATTLFENIMLPFFTIFGLRRGLDLSTASFLLGFSIIACAFLFYPIGRLSDKWSRGGVALICAGVATLCAAALFSTITTWAAWPLTLLTRAGAFGLYGVAMTVMGDKLKGPDLIAGTTIMTMSWGLGGIIGPPLAGTVIDFTSINALPFLMAMPYALCFAALAFNKGQMLGDKA
jgi:MFS family permease